MKTILKITAVIAFIPVAIILAAIATQAEEVSK